jgi:hypothetical protein
MSLINDALKKAQRERTGSAAQPLPASTTTPAAGGRPTGHAPAPARNLWPIAVAALALVGGGAAVWFLKPSAPAPVTVAANVSPAASTAAAVPSVSAPSAGATVATPPATPEPGAMQLHINLPAATPAAAPAPPPVAQPAPAPAPAATPAPETAAPAAPFQITLQLEDPRILAFLDNANINGIRIAADDAKLLMNKKVFRTGDVVDRELGLKVTSIRPNELIFEDKRGIQYRKIL